MDKLAVISEADVMRHASRRLASDAVREAFVALHEGRGRLFPVTIGAGAPDQSMVAVKSGFLGGSGIVGIKTGTYWPGNMELGLPNHGTTTLLLDPETGFPLALINARTLNGLRTAAANAVATDALARSDAKVLLVVGAGHQARCELRALSDARTFERILVWARDPAKASAFVAGMTDLPCEVCENLSSAVSQADVVTTITSATAPLFPAALVRPGTHVSAMGADKAGKQELDPELFGRAALFADHPAQSREIGEFQHCKSLEIASIGAVLTNAVEGRKHDDDVTIFDSSGIALQDIAIAEGIYEILRQANQLTEVAF